MVFIDMLNLMKIINLTQRNKSKSKMKEPAPISLNKSRDTDHMAQQSPAPNLAAGESWYLVQCKPHSEKIALRNFENQRFAAFLPLQKVTRRKGLNFQTQTRPLFPGYMFVAQDPGAGQWQKIKNTRGVARLVRLGAEPTPVPVKIIEELFARCDSAGVVHQCESLTAGNDAKIIDGPLAGAIAKIIDIDPNKRVHLLLDFMGHNSKLILDATAIAPTG